MVSASPFDLGGDWPVCVAACGGSQDPHCVPVVRWRKAVVMVFGPVRGGGSTLSGVFVMPVLQFESLALDTFAGSREIWAGISIF